MQVEKTLDELASLLGGRVAGNGSEVIRSVASIEDAGPGDITFVTDKKYARLLKTTRASAVIARAKDAPVGLNLLLVENPVAAFSKAIEIFRPAVPPPPGIDPRAFVHPKARLGKGVSIQPFAYVGEGADIGENAVLYPGVYVGADAVIGEGAILYSGAAIREGCVIGKRAILHCNSVVGSDGFGYSKEGAAYKKIPQRGIARIGDDVEIGASATIDRATVGETVIGRGTKIDNLVQVAHNVKVGEDAVIAAQTGIAGSTRIGSRVQFGGQVGVTGHIEVGSDVMVGAQSGVTNDVAPRSVVSGMPAINHSDWLKAASVFGRLPELKKRLAELEKRVRELEGKDKG
ncbi:MAG: UDP-3-O-(3-hydroxymyristoyl)glucosamine N-acyltransferase [Deltaproteobacteria bacterium GWB2_55_19]|nr:MAG: UDP-3-O-(3-hydroxymyristoyl)glucosamine N-acyltransferase [Deltaproteobacteria bacterium GWB2_55_19]HAO92351.1 UDP-3-O-(3-hydroxymyristoyl)glucosamine N-acyltransferase [Deltaproteobacteria bacterium]